jgi:PPOX class probable F420-dependent enzyme
VTTTQESLWEFVGGRRRGVLATVGADGMPHLTNVHYLVDESRRTIWVTTTTDRVKGRNLLRDPRAALHVQDEGNWFAFAVAEGPVAIGVAEQVGDQATDDLHRIFTAFRGPQERPAFDEQMIRKHRMIFGLTVDRLYGLLPDAEQPA